MSFFHGSSLLLGDNTIPGVQLSKELKEYAPVILRACRDWGLDFYPTVIQLLTYDEISEIAAYGGFPVRFPHWSFGAEYEELQRGYEFGSHKIFEMVINTSPCYQWLLASNTLVDNLTVIAHATGHNDFFKNNIHFSATDTNMLNKMANHGTRIRKYIARWGKERVTEFLDHVMRLETLIDGAEAWTERSPKEKVIRDERTYRYPRRINLDKDRLYMEPFINTREFRQKENERISKKDAADEIGVFKEPTKNILAYLRDNAPLKPWQADIVSMLYEEAMYFYPQRLTKTINEGWACGKSDTLIPTDRGIMKLGDIVENKMSLKVYDGEKEQQVTNWFKYENRKVYRITTNRGYVFEGSNNHRVMTESDDWLVLENAQVGDKVKIAKSNIWNENIQPINWEKDPERIQLSDIAHDANMTIWQVNYRIHQYKGEKKNDLLDRLLEQYYAQKTSFMRNKRNNISIPSHMDIDFASFIGYMIGDGHISIKKRCLGLTTGDEEQANHYKRLVFSLFGLNCTQKWDASSKNGRWRLNVCAKELQLLLSGLGMKTGVCAREKEIPDIILQSPKSVMAAFLRAYYDCDGYAGEAGVILSTASTKLSQQVQNVLINFGIISTRKLQKDGCWHVSVTGAFAKIFYAEIGFNLQRKQERLKKYVFDRKWFVKEKYEDSIVSVEHIGTDTVYDITVEDTHRYAAHGFINHNSTVDSVIMAEQGYVSLGQKSHDHGIVEYAGHKMSVLGGKYSMNPYKLGYYLLKDIRERWNKGQFGPEWDDCTDIRIKENWDKGTKLGKEKIFEVRKYYDDLTLLHEFFTEDFCREQEYFHWKHYPNGEFRIENKDFKEIKALLMRRHLNGGLPDIRLTEPNYRGKGEFMLQHFHDGRGLYSNYIFDVLSSIRAIWGNDVYLATKDDNDEEQVYCCYGTDSQKDVEVVSRKKHLLNG
jgi:stage V sporulation protein R